MSAPNFATWKPETLRRLLLEMFNQVISAMPDDALAETATDVWTDLQELKRLQEVERKS